MSLPREQFSSKLGFILAAAGSAVGIGNLVGFPVAATKNGGGAFLLIYALFVFFICLPVMLAEMSLGRHTTKDPLGAYNKVSNNHKGWGFAGFLSVLTPFMIGVFYLVVTVWIFGYLYKTVTGDLSQLAQPGTFGEFVNSSSLFIYMVVVVAVIYSILVMGVKKGIESAAKLLMPALFIMLIGLVIYVLTLDNAFAGVSYYIVPDFNKITAATVNGALSQAFFSLSLGMGILITYGSYLSKRDDIVGGAKMVAITDTAVAFTAGLLILPAIFSFNPNTNTAELSDSSVSLMFVFLPKIFLALQASLGYVGASAVAATFFLLVFFAAITSLVSIIEVTVASLIDEKGMSRKQALGFLGGTMGVLAVICTLSFGMVTMFTEFTSYAGASKSVFDVVVDIFYDTILPLNGLLVCMFVMRRWKKKQFHAELSEGNDSYEGSWLQKYVDFSLSTFIPVVLAAVFINIVAQKYFGISLLDLI
ncbi:sodium-dependent transporter [Flocculibacter collagenilyticus]|uniref:sodium-dependent transporter n=1 Tax=Flocculibacter collagenilyticus TaxID=2744479 RepID=UPI0018F7585F|nr:sodium-dependent transporter [Flocculibacter collagenilyticus]